MAHKTKTFTVHPPEVTAVSGAPLITLAEAPLFLRDVLAQYAALERDVLGAITRRHVFGLMTDAIDQKADPLMSLCERTNPSKNKALEEAMAHLRAQGLPLFLLEDVRQRIAEGVAPLEDTWKTAADAFQARLSDLRAVRTLGLPNDFLNTLLDQTRLPNAEVPERCDWEHLWDQVGEALWSGVGLALMFETTAEEWGQVATPAQAIAVHLPDLIDPSDAEATLKKLVQAVEEAAGEAHRLGAVLTWTGLEESLARLGLKVGTKAAETWFALIAALFTGIAHRVAPEHLDRMQQRYAVLTGNTSQLTTLETLPPIPDLNAYPGPLADAVQRIWTENLRAACSPTETPLETGYGLLEEAPPFTEMRAEDVLRFYAAAGPLVTGEMRVTISLPRPTSLQDLQRHVLLAWNLGLKSCGFLRQGSSAALDSMLGTLREPYTAPALPEPKSTNVVVERMVERVIRSADRRSLPPRRKGYTQKAVVGGQKIYLRTGEYENGDLGEIFISMHKEGAAFRSLMNCFAMAVSIGLQYGVPLSEFVDAFIFTRFDPSGEVKGNDAIKLATSIIDYIFRELGVSYLGRKDLAHVDLKEGLPDLLVKGQESKDAANKIPSPTSTGYIRSNLYVIGRDPLGKSDKKSKKKPPEDGEDL